MMGATQNSQSCSRAHPPAKRAGAVLRAGFTDVFVTGMLMRWMRVSPSPMAMGESLGRATVGGAEDDDQEQPGHHDLGDEARGHRVAAGRVDAVAVRGEDVRGVQPAGLAACDEVEDSGTGDGAENLGDDVGGEVGGGEALPRPEAHRHGRVQVAARDVADGVGHGQHGEPEGQRDADEADAHPGKGGREDRTPASSEHEPERPDELREQLSREWHANLT